MVAVVTQIDVWAPAKLNLGHVVGPPPLLAALYAVTSLSLAWRQRAPLAVLAFIVSAEAIYYLGYGAPEGLGTVLPTVFALYAVGRYGPLANLYVAGPMLLLCAALHELTDPKFQFAGSEVVLWAVVAAGWPAGYVFARRARESELISRRADEAVAARDAAANAAAGEERARIARELHDIVGHGISVAVLQMVAAAGHLDKEDLPGAQNRLSKAEHSARGALAEMRRLLGLLDRDMEAPLVPQPGLGQVDRLISDTRAAGATITLSIRGAQVELSPGVDLTAFRILQESLTNVLKHARPPRADVVVDYRSDRLLLEVRDHGRQQAEPATDGRGLAGMRERASLYGGDFVAETCADGGFQTRASLPIRADPPC